MSLPKFTPPKGLRDFIDFVAADFAESSRKGNLFLVGIVHPTRFCWAVRRCACDSPVGAREIPLRFPLTVTGDLLMLRAVIAKLNTLLPALGALLLSKVAVGC
jgi:hypothetical protein